MSQFNEMSLKDRCVAYREQLLQERRKFCSDRDDSWSVAELVSQQCRAFSTAMVKQFPELKLQRGFVSCSGLFEQRYEHWWCELPDGEIFDPTVEQFSSDVVLTYSEWTPESVIRVGRCMNCGDDIFGKEKDGRKSVCSAECERELANDINRQIDKNRESNHERVQVHN